VGRFIEVAAGVDPPSGLTEAVHTQTEGNPLFVTEVVRLLVQEGELTQERGSRDSWTVRIPEGVREVIGRRLNRLSQRCNETLTIASVIGREFELRQIAPLVEDISEDRLLEVLEEALASRVIEELPQAVGRYQFTHALIQETLIEELTLTRRVRLHARIAEALEQLYGANDETHAAELAHHFAEAEAVLGNDKLVKYSLIAGERALATFAWEEAQNHFSQGLAARGISDSENARIPDSEAAGLIFGLGRALVSSSTDPGQMQAAVNNLTRVFDYYFDIGEAVKAIEVAQCHVPMANRRTGMAQIIGKALTLVPPNSPVEGGLLSHYAWELGRIEGDYPAAKVAFDRALVIARDIGDAVLELRALTRSADVDLFQLHFAESLTKSLKCVELAVDVGDTYEEASARLTASRSLLFRGEGPKAQPQVSALLALAERVGDRWLGTAGIHQSSFIASLNGDWSKARDLASDAIEMAGQDPVLPAILALLEYELGNFDQGKTYLDRLLDIMLLTPSSARAAYFYPSIAVPYAARITGESSRLTEAAEAARMILSAPSVSPLYTIVARSGLGLQAVIQGNATAAVEQYELLGVIRGISVASFIAGDRMLGLLAHTSGNLDRAAAHFEEALAFCRKAGYRPGLAWTCCDYADTLLQRDNPDDRAKAMSLLDESLAISSELGMRPLMERVLSRREILKA
jgi:tetratricopeptide (TPR) repeat protein